MAEDYVWIPWDSILEHCEHVKPIRDVIPEFYVSLSPSSPQGGSWQLTEPTIDNTVYSLDTSFSPKQDDTPWHSSETNMNPYLYRAEPSLGHTYNTEYLDSVVGGTVAWNQILQNGNFESKTGWGTTRCAFNTNNNKGIFTYGSTLNALSCVNHPISLSADHVYIVSVAVKSSKASQFRIKLNNIYIDHTVVANEQDVVSGIIRSSSSASLDSFYVYPNANNVATTSDTAEISNAMVFDLTAMFGTTIADHIYALEQSTAGAGVAWFKALFPKDYYEYNAGELMSVSGLQSHDTVGFNQWDEQWEVGSIAQTTGRPNANVAPNTFRSKNYCRCLPGVIYHFEHSQTQVYVYWYDNEKNFIRYHNISTPKNQTSPVSAAYFKIDCRDSSIYNNDICINLSWSGYRNGEYEPYSKHSYPLDSTLTLRGVPKLDASNNLYYDGDTYEADGTVTRRYGVVDLGTLSWSFAMSNKLVYTTSLSSLIKHIANTDMANVITKGFVTIKRSDVGYGSSPDAEGIFVDQNGAVGMSMFTAQWDTNTEVQTAMSGVTLVYELATETTETADPYQQIQICDDFGTEGFTDSRTVPIPVGHETRYADVYPIVGWTEINVTVSPTQDAQDGRTTPVPLGQTVYGGVLDVTNGELTVTYGYIDSYNGETIGEPWISSIDAYEAGTTPTTGAQVAYELATPMTVQIPPTEIELFLGQNNIWSDTGENVHIATADDEQTGMIVTIYGKTLWMRNHIFYKDGTDEYTTPIRIG